MGLCSVLLVFMFLGLKADADNETNTMADTNALLEAKRVLEKALQETEKPLHHPQEGLHKREKRKGKKLVHDIPEQEQIWEDKTMPRVTENDDR